MHEYKILKNTIHFVFLETQMTKTIVTCHNKLHNSKHNIPMTLLLLKYFVCKCVYNAHYGRPVKDLKEKLRTPLLIICYVTMWDDTTPTLWCSHKVNVKLHSAAALQQWAFKLIWLAVKPHAGARTQGHTGTHARADTETHITRWINTKHGQSKRYRYMHWQGKVEKPCIYLERFVVGSLITIHSLISPNLLK